MSGAKYRLLIAGAADAEVEGTVDAAASSGEEGDVSVVPVRPSAAEVARGVRRFEVVVDGWWFEATAEDAAQAVLRDRAARAAAEQHASAGMTLKAQIPGRVVRLWVSEGQAVEAGERLLAIEAMKMENEIRAPVAGHVTGLRVDVNQLVERGDELLAISQAGGA